MAIELKIIITLMVLWFATHLCAHPEGGFGKWGQSKFGGYGSFLAYVFIIYAIPSLITALYWLWNL